MAKLSVPGAVINYEIWHPDGGPAGRGADWVTLVNGHTRPLNDFRMLGRKLTEQGFSVLTLDNRGAGQTVTERPFTLADMCDDVRSLWTEHGVRATNLLGISMGGFIAETLALESPEYVTALILVSTAARHDSINGDDRPWSSDLAETQAKLSTYFTPQFAEKNAVLVRSMAKQITAQVEGGKFTEHSRLQRQALAGFDVTDRLFALAAPTLVIHGTEDAIIPLAAGASLAESISGARLETIAGSGHLLLAEAPTRLYQLVVDFFRSNR